MNARPLSHTWEWIGWLPLFLLTVLITVPPGLVWSPRLSQTAGPMASIPDLTWYRTFLWVLNLLVPFVTLALLWAFERLRDPLPWATKAYWLGMVAAAMIVGCVAACYFVWQRPAVPNLAEPDFALTCWLFCGTLKSGFALMALLSGLATAAVAVALKSGVKLGRRVTTLLGLATLPVGLLLIVAWSGVERAR